MYMVCISVLRLSFVIFMTWKRESLEELFQLRFSHLQNHWFVCPLEIFEI